MNDRRGNILEYWLWEKKLLVPFLTASIAAPLIAALVLAAGGRNGLYAMPFLALGPLISLPYWLLGKKLRAMQDALASRGEFGVPARLVIGKIEQPGLVLATEDAVRLLPALGETMEIALSDIESVKVGQMFNGSALPGKRGFWLKVSGQSRIGFAVPNSYAEGLSARLTPPGGASSASP